LIVSDLDMVQSIILPDRKMSRKWKQLTCNNLNSRLKTSVCKW